MRRYVLHFPLFLFADSGGPHQTVGPFSFFFFFFFLRRKISLIPASSFYKPIAGRYRPVSYPDGPIMARCRFMLNASWVKSDSES